MLGMKKRTPAGHAAVGIILTAALLFAGGCGTNTQNQTAGSTVSEQTSELTSEQASEQGSGKMVKYVPTKADEVQNPVLYLDGDPVSQEEYAMLAQQYKNQIMMKYSTDQVNQPDFWTTEIDGETPADALAAIVQDKLQEYYAIKHLAVVEQVTDDYTYADLTDKMEQENTSRGDDSNNDTTYGLNNFDMSTYYSYWYSNLQTQLTNALTADSVKASDADCKKYYSEHLTDFTYTDDVQILYAEITQQDTDQVMEAEAKGKELAQAMQKATNEDDLQNITYADVQALELNSHDTQEGMSGVYRNRWEIAKGLSAGEVYGPYEDNGKICVMKCIEKEADGQIAYENVKDQIARYLQVQQVDQMIQDEKDGMQVTAGTISVQDAIVQAFN